MLYTIYVDSLYGLDTNTGELLTPVRTLPYALTQVYEGGIIVLQTGTGTTYGNLTVTKNLTIKAAYGATPVVGSLTLSGIQGLVEGITFRNLTIGITASNISLGSMIIRDCSFDTVQTPIRIDSVNYIALHRNRFYDFNSAIRVTSAVEVCISSNIFSNGRRSVEVVTADRLDLWGNTIYGALDLPDVPFPDTNLRIVYKTLNEFDITYKRLQLPGFASPRVGGSYDVAFNVVNGPSFNYGTDFTVLLSGSLISWSGLQLETEFQVGDVVRVMYSESSDIEQGDAIRIQNIGDQNSRVDSNSISQSTLPVAIGVYFTTPIKIRNNNFYGVTRWWGAPVSVVPTGATGINNISANPLYVDPINDNFKLQDNSPNINKGDSTRWSDIYSEMGVIKVGENYTASSTGIVDRISSFDRDLDFDLFHRGATGIQGVTGDIGAYEYNSNETAMGNYVAEFGQDIAYPGTETGPYATPDRGYLRAGNQDLHIATNVVPVHNSVSGIYEFSDTGSSYSRFRSKDIVLSNGNLIIGSQAKNDVVIIYPSHPSYETGLTYVSPDGDNSWTGTINAPYRTIDRALQDGSPYILVEPGYYPPFQGVSGINLIGAERVREMGLSGIYYNNVRNGSWTGPGDYSYTKDSMSITSPANVLGLMTLNSEIDFKITASVKSNDLTIKLFNIDNSVWVKISRYYSVVTLGYTTGGITYEVNKAVSGSYTLDELFSNLKIRFLLKGNKFSMYLDGAHVSASYSSTFVSGTVSEWSLQFTNTGTGVDTVTNLNAFASSIDGVTGTDKLLVFKKLFAIMGSTGAQG
jgi:hypothetical protein